MTVIAIVIKALFALCDSYEKIVATGSADIKEVSPSFTGFYSLAKQALIAIFATALPAAFAPSFSAMLSPAFTVLVTVLPTIVSKVSIFVRHSSVFYVINMTQI